MAAAVVPVHKPGLRRQGSLTEQTLLRQRADCLRVFFLKPGTHDIIYGFLQHLHAMPSACRAGASRCAADDAPALRAACGKTVGVRAVRRQNIEIKQTTERQLLFQRHTLPLQRHRRQINHP